MLKSRNQDEHPVAGSTRNAGYQHTASQRSVQRPHPRQANQSILGPTRKALVVQCAVSQSLFNRSCSSGASELLLLEVLWELLYSII